MYDGEAPQRAGTNDWAGSEAMRIMVKFAIPVESGNAAIRTGKLEIRGLGGSYGVECVTLYRMSPAMGPPGIGPPAPPAPITPGPIIIGASTSAILR